MTGRRTDRKVHPLHEESVGAADPVRAAGGVGGRGWTVAGDHHTRTSEVQVASLVLYAADREATEAFYRALGLDLVPESHDGGPVHSVTTLGGDVHFAVYQADPTEPAANPAWQQAGSSFPGLWVSDLDATTEALAAAGHPILLTHESRSWGCRVVVEDPDGRPIEVNQRSHCPG